jgi:hypothetical protein
MMTNDKGTVAELRRAAAALRRNDLREAWAHIELAQVLARANARRDRQLVEIARCAISADRVRAAGLAAEHCSTFPEDSELLASIVDTSS